MNSHDGVSSVNKTKSPLIFIKKKNNNETEWLNELRSYFLSYDFELFFFFYTYVEKPLCSDKNT